MSPAPVRVLLVDDDEDDFIITRDLIAEIGRSRYRLDWISDYATALATLQRHEHDVCLLDYRLGEKTGLDLNGVMLNLQSMLPQMLGEQINLEFRCQPDLPLVAADATMTEQILMNLAVNAPDSMPGGGTFSVETSAVEIPIALARQNPDARAGGSFV
jgi:signal transduction histidine kinase